MTDASFTPAQLQAINAGDGPMAVVAGPGCGKTTLLAARIGALVRAPNRSRDPRYRRRDELDERRAKRAREAEQPDQAQTTLF